MKQLLALLLLLCLIHPVAYGETIDYDNGDRYVGETLNGVRDGYGTYTYTDGAKYVGEWKDGLYHGHGTYTYSDGAKYVGEYKDGVKWNGVGYNPDGTIKGNYINGVYEPEGSDCVKKREWTEDGQAMIDCTFADGERYVGGLKDNNWHGYGTYSYPDGEKYVGEYKNGRAHGYGTYIFASGEKYVGEYKAGLRHGQGTYIWPDGGKYVGELKDDRPWNGAEYDNDGSITGTYSDGEWVSE